MVFVTFILAVLQLFCVSLRVEVGRRDHCVQPTVADANGVVDHPEGRNGHRVIVFVGMVREVLHVLRGD